MSIEEDIANSVGGGGIAGIDNNPPGIPSILKPKGKVKRKLRDIIPPKIEKK